MENQDIKPQEKTLFDSYTLGDLQLRNRIVMASLTRYRCDPKTGVPSDMNATYYGQRAKHVSLILTESSPISHLAQAQLGAGGCWTKEQMEGWKKVVDAVHKEGSYIFLQLWHAGRVSHPLIVEEENIGPSPIAIRGTNRTKNAPHAQPREMTLEDIKKVRDEFKQAAINAKEAGFDGVELQGANAYLIDQFLKDTANHRTDEYGGSIENRCRFCLEVIDDVISVFGSNRVGIKLSPVGRSLDIYESEPVKLYAHLLTQLDERKIAFIQLMEPSPMHSEIKFKTVSHYEPGENQIKDVAKTLRPYFKGTIMCNNKLTPEEALDKIKAGDADLVSFGRWFISNPDLPLRIKNNWPIAEFNDNLFYGGNEKGYTDYPYYEVIEESS